MKLHRAVPWIVSAVVGIGVAYVLLLIVGFETARDVTYFEEHPEEHKQVLEECRNDGGWFPECEAAEAVAE
ncbi:hypothetical protein LUX29_10100 [Aureimonas altamirensis]|uniref:hypothetical protein n=1 Tax=Aureimonas altamirensis TaxID=370622 RepID=UPI001E63826C|nr:hypothetical protein [Aureimonas altamirensis]UHD47486.1 hypothetical protein LUX29_10100 [Aureimonas altamirensis]